MKKILIIHHWSSIGGSGISLYNTWEQFQNDYEVITYIPEKPSDLAEFLDSKGLKTKKYPFVCGQIPYYSGGSNLLKPSFWYLIFKSISQITYWKKVIFEENPDIIIVNSKVLCWMGKLFKDRHSICFVRETIKGNPKNLINRIMKYLLEDFSLVSFLSQYDLEQTDLKKAKSVVSPDFLEMENYQDKLGKKIACKKLNVDSEAFNVAFVGGVDNLKGIDILIKAAKILKEEKINILIAGNDIATTSNKVEMSVFNRLSNIKSTMFSRKIRKIIDKNNITNIKFIGIQRDISLLYSASDILAFPMKKPHQARPAFEIGVQKKPVIISDFPNIREFFKNEINGLNIHPNNPEALADAILKLKNNDKLLKEMGENNYDYTTSFHTAEYSMKKLNSKINEMIYGGRKDV